MICLHIRRAKNDPFGKGAKVKTNMALCPVTATLNYIVVRPDAPVVRPDAASSSLKLFSSLSIQPRTSQVRRTVQLTVYPEIIYLSSF